MHCYESLDLDGCGDMRREKAMIGGHKNMVGLANVALPGDTSPTCNKSLITDKWRA